MKLLQFAIASLVDANTSGNYARHVSSFDTAAAEREARAIRSRSIIALGQAIGASLKRSIAEYRERRSNRRALDDMLHLSDHHLDDIGLHRGDLVAVELGATTLDELNAKRETRRNVSDSHTVGRVDNRAVADNDEALVSARCA